MWPPEPLLTIRQGLREKESKMEGFDEFWKLYPRRVAKQAAMKAYARALKMTTSQAILKAARQYARERIGQDATFTKHPATWLNAGCWGDYELTQVEEANPKATGFYVSFNSPELVAWEDYERQIGRTFPRDKRGGWVFPTRWPPGHENAEAA